MGFRGSHSLRRCLVVASWASPSVSSSVTGHATSISPKVLRRLSLQTHPVPSSPWEIAPQDVPHGQASRCVLLRCCSLCNAPPCLSVPVPRVHLSSLHRHSCCPGTICPPKPECGSGVSGSTFSDLQAPGGLRGKRDLTTGKGGLLSPVFRSTKEK